MAAQEINYYFRLQISQQQFLRYYQGTATDIHVRSENGQTLRFPAKHMRPFVTANGISGRFCLTVTAQHRFVRISRAG